MGLKSMIVHACVCVCVNLCVLAHVCACVSVYARASVCVHEWRVCAAYVRGVGVGLREGNTSVGICVNVAILVLRGR